MHAWEKFLLELENSLGRETVIQWLRPLKVTDFDACNLYLEAQDSFQLAWFEEHMRQKVKGKLANPNGNEIKVHLTLRESAGYEKKGTKRGKFKPNEKVYRPALNLGQDPLDESATLDDFLVSSENELTFKCVCEMTGFSPKAKKLAPPKVGAENFNPIFIYGNSGSGKTHLLMACASLLQKQGLSVLYIRAETFTEHVVAAIRNGAMQEFRKAYRHVDVLIIDDVHIFARRGATQEEFFHTFNSLHSSGRQIILSANSPPQLLEAIEPRLISRFEWGILLHLERFSPQEIKSWISKRALSLDLLLDDETIDYLIKTFQAHTKSLERALHALVIRSQSGNTLRKHKAIPIDAAKAKGYLFDLIEEERLKGINPPKIIRAVADYFGMRTDDLLGKSQARDSAVPRQMAMYICRMLLQLPYLKIGQIFGRDHSTVMSSVKQVEEKVKVQDKDTCAAKFEILRRLESQDLSCTLETAVANV